LLASQHCGHPCEIARTKRQPSGVFYVGSNTSSSETVDNFEYPCMQKGFF
jgi:hypothetical protein